ncbi:hypothetical protein X738_26740 [Mesorhizobium sp. LNHC209A00]|nr:hypothetical protein X738_26740 [Mesorhizobium sp. LNHC209A00]
MANGRCAWHGGRSPKGDAWGLPVWPNPDSPDVEKKLQRKLAERERAAKKRAVRLATMSTDQRKRHDAWHAARKPGSAAAREQARSDRRQATELRAMRAKPQPPPTREAADLESQIAALRAELEQRQPDNPKPIGAFS